MKTQVEVENLDKKRTQWLTTNLLGFFLWDGTRILNNYVISDQADTTVLFAIGIIGWLIWIISLIMIIRASKKIQKDKDLNSALNDEYANLNRLKSWRNGLVTLFIVQVIVLIVAIKIPVSGQLSAEVSIFTGVVAVLLSFIVYHK